MNNNFRPLCEDEVKSKKTELLKKLNIFLKKEKPYALGEIIERKKQLREKAIKAFGDIKLKKLTYTKSPEKFTSDQSILLNNKQKEFLMENKSEILNLLEFIEKVNEGVLNKDEVEKHMFDMTNINTHLEKIWYKTTNALRLTFFPLGYVTGFFGAAGLAISTQDIINSEEFRSFMSLMGGIFVMGGTWALGEYIHNSSKITKRAEEIKSHNNIFVKAYIYHDDYCKKMFENNI